MTNTKFHLTNYLLESDDDNDREFYKNNSGLHYEDFVNQISADDLYKGLLVFGFLNDRLPPFLTSEIFYNYCIQNDVNTAGNSNKSKGTDYVQFDCIRNTNVPRHFGIPTPFAYNNLCKILSRNWEQIKKHFEDKTAGQEHLISRIHLRKINVNESLFSMTYRNWKLDDNPEPDLLIGNKFIVKADISKCFPSIYTHSICWALIGKEKAKKLCYLNNKNKSNSIEQATNSNEESFEWVSDIDKYTRYCKNNETNGILIGPHASNLLAEIILITIDAELYNKGWRFIRNIDDYTCYVSSEEKAKQFLLDLSEQLDKFKLEINQNKVEILALPKASTTQWVRKINLIPYSRNYSRLTSVNVRAYLDSAIELVESNNNAAVLNYAIKVLSRQQLTAKARSYCIKTILHLTLIYPYLVSILEKFVFERLDVEPKYIKLLSENLFDSGLSQRNYEAVSYAVYFAIKYGFELKNLKSSDAISSNSCIFKLLALLYFKKYKNIPEKQTLKEHAQTLNENAHDRESNWLFVYEALSYEDLTGEWKSLKKAKVSFVKEEFRA